MENVLEKVLEKKSGGVPDEKKPATIIRVLVDGTNPLLEQGWAEPLRHKYQDVLLENNINVEVLVLSNAGSNMYSSNHAKYIVVYSAGQIWSWISSSNISLSAIEGTNTEAGVIVEGNHLGLEKIEIEWLNARDHAVATDQQKEEASEGNKIVGVSGNLVGCQGNGSPHVMSVVNTQLGRSMSLAEMQEVITSSADMTISPPEERPGKPHLDPLHVTAPRLSGSSHPPQETN